MKQRVLLGALAVVLLLGFISVAPTAAQTNPAFKAWLADLDGSKWVYPVDGGKYYWELHGDIITQYGVRFTPCRSVSCDSQYQPGVPVKQATARLRGRRFTIIGAPGNTFLYEISEDGLVLTEEVTASPLPQEIGRVYRYLKEN